MKDKHLQKLVTRLVKLSFKDGKMIESQVTKSIKALKSLPRYQAIETLELFIRELKRLEREHTIFIETAISLSKPQINKIKKLMDKKATIGNKQAGGKQVKITKVVTQINPTILGGFRLRLGDEVWDETLKNKITQVKEAIIGGRSD